MSDYNDEFKNNDGSNDFNASGDIDYSSINRAAQQARFYRKMALAVACLVIIIGVGCGIFLYAYIAPSPSSGIDETEIFNRKKTSRPASQARTEQDENVSTANKKEAGQVQPSESGQPEKDRPAVEKKTPSAVPVIRKNQQAQQRALTSEVLVAAVKTTKEVTVKSGKTAEVKVSEAPDEKNAEVASVQTPETRGVEISAGTREVKTAAKEAAIDTVEIERKMAAGDYKGTENLIGSELKKAGANGADVLNLMLAKQKFYVENKTHEAMDFFSKVKKQSSKPVLYALLYIKFYGRGYEARCRQVIDNLFAAGRDFTDDDRIEVAKAAFEEGLYTDVQKLLNSIVAASGYKDETGFIKRAIEDQKEAERAKAENYNYSFEKSGLLSGGKIAAVHESDFYKPPQPLKGIVLPEGSNGRIYAYESGGKIVELSASTSRPEAAYQVALPVNFRIVGMSCVYGSRLMALIRSGGCRMVSIPNSLSKKDFAAPYFSKPDLPAPAVVSPSGSHAVMMMPDEKKKNCAVLHVVSLKEGKTVAKIADALYRENDTGFLAFSSEMKKYSVDTLLESRYLYYFKYLAPEAGTGEVFTNRLKLYAFDLERLEESSYFQVKTNNVERVFIAFPAGLEKPVVSFEGSASGNTFIPGFSGTFVLSRNFDGVTCISGDIYSSFCAQRGASGPVSIYALTPDGREVKKFNISEASADKMSEYIKSSFKQKSRNICRMIRYMQYDPAFAASAEKAKMEAGFAQKFVEYEKMENEKIAFYLKTLKRLKLYKLAAEKAALYISRNRAFNTDEIKKLKEEAERNMTDEK